MCFFYHNGLCEVFLKREEFETSRAKVPASSFVDYYIKESARPKEVWLLLHGYGESSFSIVKRMTPLFPEDVTIVAPNAPFPLPQKVQSTIKLGFGWYFYDSKIDKYFIDFSIACEILKNLIFELGLNETPLRIIGYSQGGYLAPFLGLSLKNTFHAIGINSSTRVDFIKQDLNFCFDQIHGTEDEMVDFDLAKSRFENLKSLGNSGNFFALDGEKHFLSRNYLPVIENIIKKNKPK